MIVEKRGDRYVFLVRPGERFRLLKYWWHSFLIGWREGFHRR